MNLPLDTQLTFALPLLPTTTHTNVLQTIPKNYQTNKHLLEFIHESTSLCAEDRKTAARNPARLGNTKQDAQVVQLFSCTLQHEMMFTNNQQLMNTIT